MEPPVTPRRGPRGRAWLRGWRAPVVLYLAFAGAYLGASGARLRGHSPYNHYVYLADGWLHGRLTLADRRPTRTTGPRSTSSS